MTQTYRKLENIKVVLIDVDNTLLDFEKSSQTAISRACEDFGIEYTPHMLEVFLKVNDEMWRKIQDGKLTKAQLWQTRWNRIFDILNIDTDGPMFEQVFHTHLRHCAATVDGAVEAMKYLHSKYTVCTASNASYKQQHDRLQLSGLLRYIDNMFVSEQIGAQKPSLEFFDACTQALSISPQNTLMIGDDIHADMLGAYRYGMHTCWFNPNALPNEEKIPLDNIISNLKEIKLII